MSVYVLDYRLAGDKERDKLVHHHIADENCLVSCLQIYSADCTKVDVFCYWTLCLWGIFEVQIIQCSATSTLSYELSQAWKPHLLLTPSQAQFVYKSAQVFEPQTNVLKNMCVRFIVAFHSLGVGLKSSKVGLHYDVKTAYWTCSGVLGTFSLR